MDKKVRDMVLLSYGFLPPFPISFLYREVTPSIQMLTAVLQISVSGFRMHVSATSIHRGILVAMISHLVLLKTGVATPGLVVHSVSQAP
jgi:hypothetical protein